MCSSRRAAGCNLAVSGNWIYFTDLYCLYRLCVTAVVRKIRHVCQTLWRKLINVCLPLPSEEEWKKISDNFQTYANFPNCLGAADVGHIRIINPVKSGPLFYGYKQFFSTVLLAAADSNYRFIFVDVGSYAKRSYSSILKNSAQSKRIQENTFIIPQGKPLDGTCGPSFLTCSSEVRHLGYRQTCYGHVEERICLQRKESSTTVYVEQGDLSSAHSVY